MASTYPVRVDAHLDPGLNRWLWLVKWLLAIPHYFVLAFLWIAFTVLSVVAFFAILFTGRYPPAIFDFNVGVLRWTWRVTYYAYGALATDHYPPFTLAEVPDYPAHLEIAYPERLSRGLVLVKWWLLAIPQYLVVTVLIGGGLWWTTDAGRNDAPWVYGGGLIGLLVLVAAVVLAVTGSYPQQLFDLVLGLNRWVLRVAAYAALMTDTYPPFRLDMGGDDPAGHPAKLTVTPPAPTSTAEFAPTPQAAAPAPPGVVPPPTVAPTPVPMPPPQGAPTPPRPGTGPAPGGGWGAGRVVLVVLGSLVMTAALGLGLAGASVGVAGAALRDSGGYVMTGDVHLATPTHAVATGNLALRLDGVPNGVLGDAKVRVTPRGTAPVFVGIAPTAAVRQYLAGVGHANLVDLNGIGAHPVYQVFPGGAPASPPTHAGIWAASVSGAGQQALTFTPRTGDWTLVVMNADGSSRVDVDAAAGAKVPALGWLVGALLFGAVMAALLGLLLLYLGLRSPTEARQ